MFYLIEMLYLIDISCEMLYLIDISIYVPLFAAFPIISVFIMFFPRLLPFHTKHESQDGYRWLETQTMGSHPRFPMVSDPIIKQY